MEVLHEVIVHLNHFRHFGQLGTDSLGVLAGCSHACSLIALIPVKSLEAVLDILHSLQPIICFFWT